MTQTTLSDPVTLAGATPADEDSDSIDNMYLIFAVSSEDYGVPIAMVTEIVGMQRIMAVPDVPDYIKGVINLRGKVIPLMDVRLRFGIAERAYDDRTVIIVLDVGDAPVGLIVDGVREVTEIADDKVDRAAGISRDDAHSVVSGLGRIDERVAILLNVPVLVSDAQVSAPIAESA